MAPVTPSEIAQALGFWPVLSETAPTPPMAHSVPVVWIDKTTTLTSVPILPAEPAWNDRLAEFTIPSLVGVEYLVDGVVVAAGTIASAPGERVVVEARATPGYHIPGVYRWDHPFPDPSLVTLIASEAFSGADVATLTGRHLDNSLGGDVDAVWTQQPLAGSVWKMATQRLTAGDTNGWIGAPIPAKNPRVSFVLADAPAHGAFSVILRAGSLASLGGIGVNINSHDVTIAYRSTAGTGGGRHTFSPGGKLPAGTYELQWFEGGLTVTIPGKTPHWFDCTDVQPSSMSNLLIVRSAVFTAATTVDSIVVHRLGTEA